MIFDEDGKRREIQIYDKQFKVWYEFLRDQQLRGINNYLGDAKDACDKDVLKLQEQKTNLENELEENRDVLNELNDESSRIEYYLEIQNNRIQEIEEKIEEQIKQKEQIQKDKVSVAKEEINKALCDIKYRKIDDWLKSIQPTLTDKNVLQLLEACSSLIVGPTAFVLQEFIEKVLSKPEQKNEIEVPASWQNQNQKALPKTIKLSFFSTKFAIYNRADLNNENRIKLQKFLSAGEAPQAMAIEGYVYIFKLLKAFQKWDAVSTEVDQLEQHIKEKEQQKEELQSGPEFKLQEQFLEFLRKEEEFTESLINQIEQMIQAIEELLQCYERYDEYQISQKAELENTLGQFNPRNEDVQLLYQPKEQVIELK